MLALWRRRASSTACVTSPSFSTRAASCPGLDPPSSIAASRTSAAFPTLARRLASDILARACPGPASASPRLSRRALCAMLARTACWSATERRCPAGHRKWHPASCDADCGASVDAGGVMRLERSPVMRGVCPPEAGSWGSSSAAAASRVCSWSAMLSSTSLVSSSTLAPSRSRWATFSASKSYSSLISYSSETSSCSEPSVSR
mmetsp:Transcript_72754/g.196798  ORF Transcript_72754/g.196798 Transcript_72754/m.196798 type:complete len:204 (+) Transcript_72754:76-687(+)